MRYTRFVSVACRDSDKLMILDADANYTLYRALDTGRKPMGVATGIDGDVWVANYDSQTVTRFKRTENIVDEVTYSKMDYAVGLNPYSIFVDYNDNVWVTCQGASVDFPHGCIFRLTAKDNYTVPMIYPCSVTPGTIAQDSDGNIWFNQIEADAHGENCLYIIYKDDDYGNPPSDYIAFDEPITSFAISDKYLFVATSSGGPGTLSHLHRVPYKDTDPQQYAPVTADMGTDLTSLTVSHDGRKVFATSSLENKVYYWYLDSSDQEYFNGVVELGDDFSTPNGISCDIYDTVYVSCTSTNNVAKLTYDDDPAVKNYVVSGILPLFGGLAPVSYGDGTGLQLMNIYNYRFFITHNGHAYTYNQFSQTVEKVADDPSTLTDEQFKNEGMYRLSDISPRALNDIMKNFGGTMDVIMWSSNVLDDKNYVCRVLDIPKAVFITQKDDMSLAEVDGIESVEATSTLVGNGNIRIVVSVDKGSSWHAYDMDDQVWKTLGVPVDDYVGNDGMFASTINDIPSSAWQQLIDTSLTKTFRWGYFIAKDNQTDVANIGEIKMNLLMKGYWVEHNNGNVTYELRSPLEMKFIVTGDGTYRINYTIVREPDMEDTTDNLMDGWMQEDVTILSTDTVNGNLVSPTNPYVKVVQIPYTSDFRRREPYVLKYVSGEVDELKTAFSFDSVDANRFDVYEDGRWVSATKSKYLEFNGTMKLKSNYSINLGTGKPIDEQDPSAGRISMIDFKKNGDGTISITNPLTAERYNFNSIKRLSISPVA